MKKLILLLILIVAMFGSFDSTYSKTIMTYNSDINDIYNIDIHDAIKTLLEVGAIYGDDAIGKTMYYKDRIYKNNEDVKVVRDEARKWMKDSVYANIKQGIYKLLNNGYITSTKYESLREIFYADIFVNNIDLASVYKNFRGFEETKLINYVTSTTKFEIEIPSVVQIGEAVDVTIKAVDKNGTVVKGYLGSIIFNSENPEDIYPSPGKAISFSADDNGIRKFSKGVIFKKLGNQKLYVFDLNVDIQGEAMINVLEKDVRYLANPYYNQIKSQQGAKLAQLSLEKLESSLKKTKLTERKYKVGSKNKLRLQALISVIEEEIRLRMEDEIDIDNLLN